MVEVRVMRGMASPETITVGDHDVLVKMEGVTDAETTAIAAISALLDVLLPIPDVRDATQATASAALAIERVQARQRVVAYIADWHGRRQKAQRRPGVRFTDDFPERPDSI